MASRGKNQDRSGRSSTAKGAGQTRARGKFRRPARQVGELLADILDPVIAKRSGVNTELAAAWADIVGPPHGEASAPVKIDWPRGDDEFRPGRLTIACDGPAAVFIQHSVDEIKTRLNTFFGFAAIDTIRVVQRPIEAPRRKKRPTRELAPAGREQLDRILAHVEDDELRARLEALGRGVLTRSDEAG